MSHFTLDQMLEKSRAVNALERLAEAEELLREFVKREPKHDEIPAHYAACAFLADREKI